MKKLHVICGKCGSDNVRPGTYIYSKYIDIQETLMKVEDHVLSQVYMVCDKCKNIVFLNELKDEQEK